MVLDGAGMIEPGQRAKLMKKLGELSKYGMDYVVCTVKSLNGSTAEACADDIFDSADSVAARIEAACCCLSARAIGSGIFQQGIRNHRVYRCGNQYIGEELKEKMKSADYAGTFFGFADLLRTGSPSRQKDRPYDTSNLPIKPLSFKYIPISLGMDLVIALIAVSVL